MIEKANNKEALNLNNNYKYITPYTLGLVMSSPTNCPIRIGDLLISTISRNPSEDYVGTEWVLLKDRFLIGAGGSYSAGSTGGEATHKLTVNEMPEHNHNLPDNVGLFYVNGLDSGVEQIGVTMSDNGWWVESYKGAVNFKTNGGNQAHNNMPPYLAVYMWKRIK